MLSNRMYLSGLSPRKTIWLIAGLLLFISVLKSQELIDSGVLSPLQYEFTGPKDHHNFPALVHALAYSQNKEAGKVKAVKTISVHYKVIRIPNKGFETILSLHPQEATGDLSFYDFYWPQMILPALESFKLLMKNNDEYIYVKYANVSDTSQRTFYFKFKHQRYASDWDLSIKDVQWKSYFSDDEFKVYWNSINDYQSAVFLLNEEPKLAEPENYTSRILYKLRWLAIYEQLEQQPFYQKLVIEEERDPKNLKRNLEIRKFLLSREIEQLRNSSVDGQDSVRMEELAEVYLRSDFELHQVSQKDLSIYSAMYFSFDHQNKDAFCLDELDHIFSNLEAGSRKKFEQFYQKMSIQKIDQYIEEKLPKEALYQIEKFNAFYENAVYLKKSATFNRYKSKAVYEIYLSYIQVARQALDRDRIEMAMDYLDQASLIQQKYSSEIINDIYIQKELRNLVKKALERYQQLLENGDHENAKQVKEGIMGLMKRFGMSQIDS
ncbi:MAG: hypothetical protein GQ527_09275 [Bacteroidales bacterium]|nr:hypothetical protein [Bacteroidales bacterium]